MTTAAEFIDLLTGRAVNTGDIVEPTALLQVVQTRDVVPILSPDNDYMSAVFGAFFQEFDSLRALRSSGAIPDPNEAQRLEGVLRWAVTLLRDWEPETDLKRHKLAAAFTVTQAFDIGGRLWSALPNELLSSNSNLSGVARNILSSLRISASVPDSAPINDRETFESFKAADLRRDWPRVVELWTPFERSGRIQASHVYVQAGRCLYSCAGPSVVAEALKEVSTTFEGMIAAGVFSPAQKFAISLEGKNPHFQFCCVYQASSLIKELDDADARALGNLLVQLAGVQADWDAYMTAFNAFPTRYPALQKSLGYALANVSDSAIVGYVLSIRLSLSSNPSDANRGCVSNCLRTFRGEANQERRRALWRAAFDRWSTWDFGKNEKELTPPHEISYTALDYAIVGYSYECMTVEERDSLQKSLMHQCETMHEEWYASKIDFTAHWIRLLSRMQPFEHALSVPVDNGEWLPGAAKFLPFDPTLDAYRAIKYA